ncbi:MAG: nucleotide exchange factor GrpE [Candidatus Solibacter usitatus]|nr:nucleotide exchange factor GrpE [Candidatus Solibacter usitatus]
MENDTPQAEAPPLPGAGQPEPDSVELSDSVLTIEAVAAERDRLQTEKTELSDRFARLAAEFDNFRKRTEREKCELLEYGSMDAVKAMLPVLDDLERAFKTETADVEYARGVALTQQRMADLLLKLGLEPIAAEGQPFDPNLHHGIDRVESEAVEHDTVVAEYQRGYTFKGRLLRPAMVRVAVKA